MSFLGSCYFENGNFFFSFYTACIFHSFISCCLFCHFIRLLPAVNGSFTAFMVTMITAQMYSSVFPSPSCANDFSPYVLLSSLSLHFPNFPFFPFSLFFCVLTFPFTSGPPVSLCLPPALSSLCAHPLLSVLFVDAVRDRGVRGNSRWFPLSFVMQWEKKYPAIQCITGCFFNAVMNTMAVILTKTWHSLSPHSVTWLQSVTDDNTWTECPSHEDARLELGLCFCDVWFFHHKNHCLYLYSVVVYTCLL